MKIYSSKNILFAILFFVLGIIAILLPLNSFLKGGSYIFLVFVGSYHFQKALRIGLFGNLKFEQPVSELPSSHLKEH